MRERESRLSRRDFVKISAVGTAMSAGWYSIAMKTDAMDAADEVAPVTEFRSDDPTLPYTYSGP
jgi:hypothetical protein